jgi:hypothetical protein
MSPNASPAQTLTIAIARVVQDQRSHFSLGSSDIYSLAGIRFFAPQHDEGVGNGNSAKSPSVGHMQVCRPSRKVLSGWTSLYLQFHPFSFCFVLIILSSHIDTDSAGYCLN